MPGENFRSGLLRVERSIGLSECMVVVLRMGQMRDFAAGKHLYVTFPHLVWPELVREVDQC